MTTQEKELFDILEKHYSQLEVGVYKQAVKAIIAKYPQITKEPLEIVSDESYENNLKVYKLRLRTIDSVCNKEQLEVFSKSHYVEVI